jgi:hypothetical protein
MLGDLGLGKSLETVSQLTMPGGTPAYVAPEQVMGDRLDHRADLYSLGAVAYAAFTGQAPHGVASLGAVMRIDAPPPSMSTLREDVPDAIDVVVRRALEPDREKRWPDLDSFLNALDEAHRTGKVPAGLVPAEELPVPAGPGGVDQATQLAAAPADAKTEGGPDAEATVAATPAPRRNRRAGWIAAVLAVILAGGGGYGGYQLVMSRPVDVAESPVSVEVPRSWDEKSAQKEPSFALLISENTRDWQSVATTSGVFIGVLDQAALPTAGTAPSGCKQSGTDTPTAENPRVTFRYDCDSGADVMEQYRKISDKQLLRIQVRGGDPQQRTEVLDSVKYNGS